MRCREIKVTIDTNGKKKVDVVWFGSTGTKSGFDNVKWDAAKWDEIGKANFANSDKSSIADKQQAVVSSLIQRLSVIKRELWYAMSYGLPLFEKNRSKTEFDAFVLSTISSHPDVSTIQSFTSKIVNHQYTCKAIVISVYGQILVNI